MLKIKSVLIYLFCFVIFLSCKVNSNPIFNSVDKSFKENGVKLTFYIGLNDKDKYIQLIKSEDAEKILQEIFLKYTSGFTILKSKGVWNDGKETTFENGFIVILYFDSSEKMYLEQYAAFISDEITEKLNQTSVLVEFSPVNYQFYYK